MAAASPSSFGWKPIKAAGDSPLPRRFHTCVNVGNTIYLLGGESGGPVKKEQLQLFSLKESSYSSIWTTEARVGQPPSNRHSHATVVNSTRKAILFGGIDADGSCDNQVFIWSLVGGAGAWFAPRVYGTALSPRYAHSINNWGQEKIVIFGGRFQQEIFNDVGVFNTRFSRWEEFSITGFKPPVSCYHRSEVIGDKLFVINGTSAVYILDLQSRKWTTVETEFAPHPDGQGHATVALEDKIFLIGSEKQGRLFFLDTTENKWRYVANATIGPSCRRHHQLLLINTSRLVLIGGDVADGTGREIFSLDISRVNWKEQPLATDDGALSGRPDRLRINTVPGNSAAGATSPGISSKDSPAIVLPVGMESIFASGSAAQASRPASIASRSPTVRRPHGSESAGHGEAASSPMVSESKTSAFATTASSSAVAKGLSSSAATSEPSTSSTNSSSIVSPLSAGRAIQSPTMRLLSEQLESRSDESPKNANSSAKPAEQLQLQDAQLEQHLRQQQQRTRASLLSAEDTRAATTKRQSRNPLLGKVQQVKNRLMDPNQRNRQSVTFDALFETLPRDTSASSGVPMVSLISASLSPASAALSTMSSYSSSPSSAAARAQSPTPPINSTTTAPTALVASSTTKIAVASGTSADASSPAAVPKLTQPVPSLQDSKSGEGVSSDQHQQDQLNPRNTRHSRVMASEKGGEGERDRKSTLSAGAKRASARSSTAVSKALRQVIQQQTQQDPVSGAENGGTITAGASDATSSALGGGGGAAAAATTAENATTAANRRSTVVNEKAQLRRELEESRRSAVEVKSGLEAQIEVMATELATLRRSEMQLRQDLLEQRRLHEISVRDKMQLAVENEELKKQLEKALAANKVASATAAKAALAASTSSSSSSSSAATAAVLGAAAEAEVAKAPTSAKPGVSWEQYDTLLQELSAAKAGASDASRRALQAMDRAKAMEEQMQQLNKRVEEWLKEEEQQ